MYKVEQQLNQVLDMLCSLDMISVDDIARKLNVSLPTARRFCTRLANEKRALRIRGGLKRISTGETDYSFETVSNDHTQEKIAIAKYASTLVKSNQVVFLEAGTTLQRFAIALGERISNKEIENVIIFTNSLINLDILNPLHANVQMIGGRYRSERKDFIGYLSELALKSLRFDYSFIGADAISLRDGVMAMDMDTVRFDAQLVTRTEHTVILVHSEKFKKHSLISYVSVQDVDQIITDNGLDPAIAEEYHVRNLPIKTVALDY